MSELLHVWEIEDGGERFYIASATEEGVRKVAPGFGVGGEEDEPYEVRVLSDDHSFTVTSPDEEQVEDAAFLPPSAVVRERDGNKPPAVTMTCGAWAKYVGEGGYIAGTIY